MKCFLFLILLHFAASNSDVCQDCKCQQEILDCSKSKVDVSTFLRMQGSDKIHYLRVEGKSIGKLTKLMFVKWSSLKKVLMVNCKISEIKPHTFESMYLTEVNLASNNLNHINSNAFRGADILQNLNLASNQLTLIPILYNENLKVLNLANNKLTKAFFPEQYKTTHIEELVLSSNHISKISKDDFKHLPFLKRLSLLSNPIDTVESGSFSIPNLEVLKLGGNIHVMPHAFCPIFADLKDNQFQSMKMTISSIDSIPEGCQFPSHISDLNLSGSLLNPKSVRSLLESVKNHLAVLVLDNCFADGISDLIFPLMKSLRKLQMRNNEIKHLSDDLFVELPNLEQLDLSRSRIFSIEDGAFDGLMKLKRLDLSSNSKLIFTIDIIAGLKLEYLTLTGTRIMNIKSCEEFGHTCVKLSKDVKIADCIPAKKECRCNCNTAKASPITHISSGSSSTDVEKSEGSHSVALTFGLLALAGIGIGVPAIVFRRKLRLLLDRNGSSNRVRYQNGHVSLPVVISSQVNNRTSHPLPDEPDEQSPLNTSCTPADHPVINEDEVEDSGLDDKAVVVQSLPRERIDIVKRYAQQRNVSASGHNAAAHKPAPFHSMTPPPMDTDSSAYERISSFNENTGLVHQYDAISDDEEDDRVVNNLAYSMADYKLTSKSLSDVDLSNDRKQDDIPVV